MVRPLNVHAVRIAQSGDGGGDGGGDVAGTGAAPLWAAGLHGQGQIVGMGDSGVDLDSCFFHHEGVVPGASHRKVVMYRRVADGGDGNGHGTHVAGTLAGNSQGERQEYNGLAYQARLAVTDIGLGASDNMLTPMDLETGHYAHAWEAGARVHTDSWGTAERIYDSIARQVDAFTWARPEFVAVFPVGNTGRQSGVEGRVGAPATNKNGIAVGATLNAASAPPMRRNDAIVGLQQVTPAAAVGALTPKLMTAEFGPRIATPTSSYRVVQGVPFDGCAPLEAPLAPSESYEGAAVLLQRGGCVFTDKVRHAQTAGAALVLLPHPHYCPSLRFELGLCQWGRPT
jgi:subtilisin family serine protease